VSYGGSSLITTLVMIGILESIHVRGRLDGAR
jgi:cell division protein FtsW (lipid II flippase)